MTITEFLLARVAEDERAARTMLEELQESPPSVYDAVQVPWIEAGEPERVLAECKAKRRIIELHPARWIYVEASRKMGEESPQVECVGGPVYDDEVRILGEVYADHEDYRDEWRMQDTSNPFSIRS